MKCTNAVFLYLISKARSLTAHKSQHQAIFRGSAAISAGASHAPAPHPPWNFGRKIKTENVGGKKRKYTK
jgi:hypothetical protein